jgi:polyisoprenoid-binding protein YceI
MTISRMTLVALLAFGLAACGGQTAAPTATALPVATIASAATSAAEPTTAPAPTTAMAAEPTAAPAATPAPAVTRARTFKIVPTQTEASYAVQETFLRQNLPNNAIGKTSVVNGEFSFSLDGKPTGKVTTITVDLSTLKSDDDRRDEKIRGQWLESSRFPLAEFTSTEVIGGPDSYTEGQEVSFKLAGNLKIHDTTKPVTFDVKGKLVGDTVTGTATTLILMKDFGFDPPTIGGFLTVTDGVTVTITFTAKEG